MRKGCGWRSAKMSKPVTRRMAKLLIQPLEWRLGVLGARPIVGHRLLQRRQLGRDLGIDMQKDLARCTLDFFVPPEVTA
jgi:hypothetical protein